MKKHNNKYNRVVGSLILMSNDTINKCYWLIFFHDY